MRAWAVRCAWLCVGGGAIACGGAITHDGRADDTTTPGGGGDSGGGDSGGGDSSGGDPASTSDVRATRVYPEPCIGIPGEPTSDDDTCVGVGSSGPHWERAIYLLVDRTIAMAEPLDGDDQSRFDAVIEGVESFSREYAGSLGDFEGVGVFGADEPECDPEGYPPLGLQPPLTALPSDVIVDSLRSFAPDGAGRWTYPAVAATLEQGANALLERGVDSFVSVEVILITAGQPSRCDSEYSPERLEALREEISAQFTYPSLVHVVELGTGLDLTPVAEAGGTGKVFSVQQGDLAEQLQRVFYAIFWADPNPIAPLAYPIPIPPDGETLDLESGRLYYGNFEVPRVQGFSDCASNPHGGWWYGEDRETLMVCDCTRAEFARFSELAFLFDCTALPPP